MPSPPTSPFRDPSPTSTINSRHGDDETSLSDSEQVLSDEQFALKWERKIGLHDPPEAEIRANKEPLFVNRPPRGSPEESRLAEQIFYNLQSTVKELRENELLDQTLMRGSRFGMEDPPETEDIDMILRSMMPQKHQPRQQQRRDTPGSSTPKRTAKAKKGTGRS